MQSETIARGSVTSISIYQGILYRPHCKMYSIDLAGYGTLQVPEKDVYCLAGFSEKIFDLMKFFEEDKDALVNTIKAIEM